MLIALIAAIGSANVAADTLVDGPAMHYQQPALRRPIFADTGDLIHSTKVNIDDDQTGRPGVRSKDFTDTVNGIDRDEDGVRDDIQQYIIANYTNRREAKGLLQHARAAQRYYLNSPDIAEVQLNWTNFDRSVQCLRDLFGPGHWTRHAQEIRVQMLNTALRVKTYIAMRKIAAGHIYPIDFSPGACE